MTSQAPYPHQRLRLKTYSHLSQQKRIPSEYELVTSQLLYYRGRGFEVQSPVAAWYERYQTQSTLQCQDWEKFHDPAELTYTKYMAVQRDREVFVEEILKMIEASDYDQKLPEQWIRILSDFLPIVRFPFHGLQMAAAYIGSMAPSGRIVIASALQMADEIRKIELLTYRMGQLRYRWPEFGENSRELWQRDELWQPLRELTERLLVTYHWGEAFVALNLCFKPALDELVLIEFPKVAQAFGDFRLGELCSSLHENSRWQRDWSAALVSTAIQDKAQNRDIIGSWKEKWNPLVKTALEPLKTRLGHLYKSTPESTRSCSEVLEAGR